MFYGSSRLAAAWLATPFALPAAAEDADMLDIHAANSTATSGLARSSFVEVVDARPVVAEVKED
jgi:hypothetical protein